MYKYKILHVEDVVRQSARARSSVVDWEISITIGIDTYLLEHVYVYKILHVYIFVGAGVQSCIRYCM